ncbi:MAG: hypothetical protein AB1349_00515 [Elusimicrobiota bacterium]
MGKLTESGEREFTRRVISILKETKDEFKGTDLNIDRRVKELETLAADADKAEAAQIKAQATARQATKVSIEKRKAAYNKASATIDAISGALGKTHALTKRLKNLRDEMALEALRGKKAGTSNK